MVVGCGRDESALVIRDVSVVDVAAGVVHPGMTIIVRGDRIARVDSGLRVPTGARAVDGSGKYAIPGLWDMHVHLAALDTFPRAPEILVSYGVTGVRDMGGRLEELDRLRTDIRSGRRMGPRMIAAGNTINGTAAADFHLVVEKPEDVRGALEGLVRWGADFFKIHNQLAPDVFHAVAEESRSLGMRFVGHVPRGVGLLEASAAGMGSLEHSEAWMEAELFRSDEPAADMREALERLSDEAGRRLFETIAANGTAMTPTLSGYRAFIDEQEDPDRRELGERLYARLAAVAGVAHAAGVTILAGTDFRSAPGEKLHRELALLVDAGLSSSAALRAATSNAASFLGVDAGLVAEDLDASFVLLDANPLDDIRNLARISAVVLRGRYFSPDELRRLRD
jgi:imidazolonepropionase-like amidohydrolase